MSITGYRRWLRYSPTGHKARTFTIFNSGDICLSWDTFSEPVADMVRKYGANEVARLMGRERWYHNLTHDDFVAKHSSWHARAIKEGLTVAHKLSSDPSAVFPIT